MVFLEKAVNLWRHVIRFSYRRSSSVVVKSIIKDISRWKAQLKLNYIYPAEAVLTKAALQITTKDVW